MYDIIHKKEDDVMSEQNQDKYIVWACPKCKSVIEKRFIPYNHLCKYCGDEYYICTDKTDDEWQEMLYQEYPDRNRTNIMREEINDYVYDKFFEGKAPNDAAVKNRLRIMDEHFNSPEVASCPKCGSTSISTQKRGFKLGRAVAGAALTGFVGTGLVAGAAGSNKMINVCQRCGHQWEPR